MKAILLVAGMGTRIKPLTDSVPKCLIAVNGRPILFNALNILERQGVDETLLVIGHLRHKIQAAVGERWGKMAVRYVENSIYDKTNTSYSLRLALKEMALPATLLILEGDVFFEPAMLADLIRHRHRNLTALEPWNPSFKGTFVAVDPAGRVVQWWHQSHQPEGFNLRDKYKTINIHKFSRGFVKDTLLPVLDRHVEIHNGKAPMEYVMREIVTAQRSPIRAWINRDRKWFEIDDAGDLEKAEALFRDELRESKEDAPGLTEMRSRHGGYWRYDFTDFHYLYNPYFPSRKLLALLKAELVVLIHHYPSSQRVVAETLSRWKTEDYFNADNLIVANGSSELIRLLRPVVNRMTVAIPTFNEYTAFPPEKLHLYPLDEANGFRMNLAKLADEIDRSGSDFAVLCNPNNPVGDALSPDQIEPLLRSGVNLIIDEAFVDCCDARYSCEPLVSRYKNLIIIKSLTKTTGVGGLRLGYLLTTNEAVKDRIRYDLPIWNINAVAERFLELFPQFIGDFEDSLKKVRRDREVLFRDLEKIPYLEPYPSQANFIFCRTRTSAHLLGEYLFDAHKIMIRDSLNQANLKSDRHIRVGVRCKADNNRLIEALRNYSLPEAR
jgi:histidinol-phosphate/aromatic aminotransferase/cobyric acid decarboxylase-like protein/choline kinase